MITLLWALALLALTLLSTSFHWPNLGMLLLLVLIILRSRDIVKLVVWEALMLSFFGQLSLGLSLFVLSFICLLFITGTENVLPGRKTSSLAFALTMMVIWEISMLVFI